MAMKEFGYGWIPTFYQQWTASNASFLDDLGEFPALCKYLDWGSKQVVTGITFLSIFQHILGLKSLVEILILVVMLTVTDDIAGGSDLITTRDLQFKTFTQTMLDMDDSGIKSEKNLIFLMIHIFLINRMYLKLKTRHAIYHTYIIADQ